MFITGKRVVVFDGDFSKVLKSFLAPYVYTKDMPKFIELKNEYNKEVQEGKIVEQDGFKPFYRLDFIEIETCKSCEGNGCSLCFNIGWDVK